jgi:hypothetical protein
MDPLTRLKRLCEWAERKCAEASASDAPWALRNLRYYQNRYSAYLGEYYAACRALNVEPEL